MQATQTIDEFVEFLAQRLGVEFVVDLTDLDERDHAQLCRVGEPGLAPKHSLARQDIDECLLRNSVATVFLRETSSDNRADGWQALLQGARAGVLSYAAEPSGAHESLDALRNLLARADVRPAFTGFAPATSGSTRAIAVTLDESFDLAGEPPETFRAAAIITCFNERDVIRPTVERLLANGLEVLLIDNWSTDDSVAQVQDLVGRGLHPIERFPRDEPSEFYDWSGMLAAVSAAAGRLDVDWILRQDPDERRDAPWPEMSLKKLFWVADQAGFNALDHTLLEFRPIDDTFIDGTDPSEHFRYFEFTRASLMSRQINAWKNSGTVDLLETGGHEARFEGRRIFPFNALLRHYSIRSQQHGERKVFQERMPRYTSAELERGWHYHYRSERRARTFVRRSADLVEFDDGDFQERFLLPRLSRVGISLPEPTARARAKSRALEIARRSHLLKPYARTRVALRRRFRGF